MAKKATAWVIAGALSSGAMAADPDASGGKMPPASLIPAWNSFVDGLRDLAPRMLAKLPERLRNDPQAQQEIGRLMLEALAARTIETIAADGDHPMFLPSLNLTLNIFQPNADTTYRTAYITPGGSYRLRGDAGSLRISKIGQFGPTPSDTGGGVAALAYHDLNALSLDKDRHFDVLLSPTRPTDYKGDWWPLDQRTTSLLIRQVAYDWSKERDPTIAIERLDIPAPRPRPTAADLDKRLRRLATITGNSASFLADHVEGLRQGGYINKLKVFDVVTNLGGLIGQFYYEGAYALAPDEALIVESEYPKICTYSSIILTNEVYETTDWYNNQSSLNGSQMHVDKDHILRIVVSAQDPGVANWLDTAGYPGGAIQGRWTDCDTTPVPSVRKVAVKDVAGLLPPDTPKITRDERDRIIRERRAMLQQRPLW
jgi:hypothetical protein